MKQYLYYIPELDEIELGAFKNKTCTLRLLTSKVSFSLSGDSAATYPAFLFYDGYYIGEL